MARTASPWFRAERNAWYVIKGGTRVCLGEHPPDAPPPRKKKNRWVVPPAILARFHELMAANPGAPPARTPPAAGLLVAEVFEKFLDWCEKNRSPRTYEWSRNHIQSFLDSLPDTRLAVDALRPFHVAEWVDAKPTWGPNHRRGAITAVQRAFSWAEKVGHIRKSPVRHVEKPHPKRREQVLTPAEFDALLGHVHDDAFRDVLVFCWETGCRVQEVRVLEARHYKADRGRFELPPSEAKGKRRWRLIYLTPRAAEVVAPLARRHPDGPIFRNADGNPWDAQAFNNRFWRLQLRTGREHLAREPFALTEEEVRALARTLRPEKTVAGRVVPKSEADLLREARRKLTDARAGKHGVKYALTAIRHSYATRLLEAGVDHITVAMLLGHVDATMLARVYQHVGEKSDFLREELLRAAGAGTPA